MSTHCRLSVNVDHIATLRQARGVIYPDPVDAARIAEAAGADGITVHLRQDRRHIQDDDIRRLRDSTDSKLNLEICTLEEMISIAIDTRPDQVTLVPENPNEITTEGGLDLLTQEAPVRRAAERLAGAGISVSLFLDPDPRQIAAMSALEHQLVDGFELNTDAYSRALQQDGAELRLLYESAQLGVQMGRRVYAGHGLTTANVGPVSALTEVEELNIGHWLVSRASLVGMDKAVREMLAAMARPQTAPPQTDGSEALA